MGGKARPKREERSAMVESVPGGILVAVVFRGAWIDGVHAKRGGAAPSEIEGWLSASGFFEALAKVCLGGEAQACMGEAGVAQFSAWLGQMGKAIGRLPPRKREQADAIIEGFRGFMGR